MSKYQIGTIGSTAQKCPESGVWQSGSTTTPMAKASTFSPCGGKGVFSMSLSFRLIIFFMMVLLITGCNDKINQNKLEGRVSALEKQVAEMYAFGKIHPRLPIQQFITLAI